MKKYSAGKVAFVAMCIASATFLKCSSVKNKNVASLNPEVHRTSPDPSDSASATSSDTRQPQILHIATLGSYEPNRWQDTFLVMPKPGSYFIYQDSNKLKCKTDAAGIQSLKLDFSKTGVVALSLVDSSLYDNFEVTAIEKIFAQYGARFIVVAVSRADSEQRSAFMISFYKERMCEQDVEKAFDQALAASINNTKQRNEALDFKARLIRNK